MAFIKSDITQQPSSSDATNNRQRIAGENIRNSYRRNKFTDDFVVS